MKKETRKVRNRIVTLRMNEEEFQSLEKNRKSTTEKTNSNYLRKLAHRTPVITLTRNASMDTLSAELIRLRKEISAIGNNFNQAVHKLHTLDRIPEFRCWIETYEETRIEIKVKSENAFSLIIKLCEQ